MLYRGLRPSVGEFNAPIDMKPPGCLPPDAVQRFETICWRVQRSSRHETTGVSTTRCCTEISIEDDPQFGSDVGHGGSCASTDDTLVKIFQYHSASLVVYVEYYEEKVTRSPRIMSTHATAREVVALLGQGATTSYPAASPFVDGTEDNEVSSNHLEDSLESEESSDHESQEVTEPPPGPDDQATTGEHVPIKFKVPLTLDFDELAGMLVEKNQRSRMNCVVEKRRAEEIVDHQPRTVKLPFGLNVTTDPRYEHVSGEKMAIFCESGNDQRHAPMEVMHGPVMIPLPGPVHLPLQFQGHPHRMHHQQQLPHPEIRAHPQHMQQLPLADMRIHLQHMQQLPVSDMRAPPQHMQQQPLSDMRPPPQQMHQLPLPDMRPPPQLMQQMPLPEIHAHPQRMQQVSIPVAFPAIHITDGQEQQLQAEEAREQQIHIPIHIQESREGRQFPHPLMAMQDGRQGRAFQHQHMQQIPIEVTEVKEGRPFPQQQQQVSSQSLTLQQILIETTPGQFTITHITTDLDRNNTR
uniref:Uncharacterized protein n=1 Tax=Timema monikensis TaxID=170555 RepID=A0A7R9EKW4_9NEOP|nr:unnamed protein product [Timema monikensis]